MLAIRRPCEAKAKEFVRGLCWRVRQQARDGGKLSFADVLVEGIARWREDLAETQVAPSAAQWLTTQQAVAHLGVDRDWLAARGPSAQANRPDAIIQVGDGKRRKRYRWRSNALGDVLNRATPKPVTPATPKKAPKPSKPNAKHIGFNLRKLTRD